MNKHSKLLLFTLSLFLTFTFTGFGEVRAAETTAAPASKVENKTKDNYNCGCGCTHSTLEECKACPCCKNKPVYKNGKLMADNTEKQEDIYNCNCGCKHKTPEECEKCNCCKGKDVYKNGKLFKKAENKDESKVENKNENQEIYYNCGPNCGCRHKTVEECENCKCCKGKDVYKNGKLFKKVGEDVYNCGPNCGCRHKTLEECENCNCCKGKDIYKNDKLFKKAENKDGGKVENNAENKMNPADEKKTENADGKQEDIYNCGCGCKHKTLEECENCPCCKGKDVYKNGKLFKKAEKKDDSKVDDKTDNKMNPQDDKKVENKTENKEEPKGDKKVENKTENKEEPKNDTPAADDSKKAEETPAEPKKATVKNVTVGAKVKVTGKTATAILNTSKIAKQIKKLDKGILKIKVDVRKAADLKLRLVKKDVKKMLSSKVKSVKVLTKIADVTVSKKVLKNLSKELGAVSLKISKSKNVYVVEFINSSNKAVQVKGNITVAVKAKKGLKAYSEGKNGKLSEIKSSFKNGELTVKLSKAMKFIVK